MKLISWNVNGLRACLDKGFAQSIVGLEADIVCLQETKMERGQADVGLGDYQDYWFSAEKKGYSGTAVFTRQKPLEVFYGMGQEDHDREGRVLRLDFDAFTLVNVYTPNSQRELARLNYRLDWEDAFRAYLKDLDTRKPVIVCGDLNVAHQEIDLRNPRANTKNAGFTPQERAKMTELLQAGFVDTFRALNPDLEGAYSWWSYRAGARERNVGWRIDYFLASRRLMPLVSSVAIHSDITGSDHCPVELDIHL